MQTLRFPPQIEELAQRLADVLQGSRLPLIAVDADDDVVIALLALGLRERRGIAVVNGRGDDVTPLIGAHGFPLALVRRDAIAGEVVGELGEHVLVQTDGAADFEDGIVLFTSGSSGERKPVKVGWDALVACSTFMNDAMETTADDVEAIYAQLDHAFAIGRIVSCALAGARFEVFGAAGRLTPASVQRILDVEGLSGLACMPSLLLRMVSIDQLRESLAARLRYVQVGAMYLPPARKLELVERLPDTRIFAHYGMTEYMRATFYELSAHRGKAHTEGRASGDTEVRIDLHDEESGMGEIQLRGPFLADGYLDGDSWRARLTDDGFFRTGDVGQLDDDGFLIHGGRLDGVFNVHGRLFSSVKLEQDLAAAMPLLEGRICVLPFRRAEGIKDSEILVFVGGETADDPVDRDIARVFGQQGLQVEVVRLPDDLPRTGTGKVAYPALREIAQHRAG